MRIGLTAFILFNLRENERDYVLVAKHQFVTTSRDLGYRDSRLGWTPTSLFGLASMTYAHLSSFYKPTMGP